MNLDLRKPTIVVTGAWNPAILELGWIARYLFDVPENAQVRAHTIVTGVGTKQLKEVTYINGIGGTDKLTS